MTEIIHHRVLIIGSGPAGYTAAVYAARAMLKPGIVAGPQPGGQLTITTDVENYPGFPEVMGPDLMEKFKELKSESGKTYTADAVIIATGAQAKWLGLPSEDKFQGFGVSACATCDGFFYRDREVVVVGGGNTAVEEALFLTNFASRVTLVHRRDTLRAEKILQKRLLENPKVEVLWDTTLEEILGDDQPLGVTGVRLKEVKTGKIYDRETHGVFIAIGHKPSTSVFKGHVAMNDGGYITTAPDSTATNIPGVFATGDVSDELFRQAVTAAGLGCMGALEAERYLTEVSAHQVEAAE